MSSNTISAFHKHCEHVSKGVYRPRSGAKINAKALHLLRDVGAFGGEDSADSCQKTTRAFIVAENVKLLLNIKHNCVFVLSYKKPEPRTKSPPQTTPFGVVAAGPGWSLTDINMLDKDEPVTAWCALVTGLPVDDLDEDFAGTMLRRALKVLQLAVERKKTQDVAARNIEAEKKARKLMQSSTNVAYKARKRAERAAAQFCADKDITEDNDLSDNEEAEEAFSSSQAVAPRRLSVKRRRLSGVVPECDLRSALEYVTCSRDTYAKVVALQQARERLAQKVQFLLSRKDKRKHKHIRRRKTCDAEETDREISTATTHAENDDEDVEEEEFAENSE